MRAAAPALAAIEQDGQRAPKRLQPLFAAIAELLFEPDLSLDQLQHAAGLSDPEIFSDLREEVGQPAWTYLRDARLETAARLLLTTPISLSEIGRMVGYGSPSTFRRTLRSFLGMSASQYRRQATRLLEQAGPPPDGTQTDEYWQRMLAGELSDSEARTLDDYLEHLAPTSIPAAEPDQEAGRWARLRQTLAEGLADTLETLPFAEQRRLARNAVWFPDGTFFEHLSRLGKEEDRLWSVGDPSGRPERGVELALLGVDSLTANQILETQPGYAALAWARLARARWRAGDLSGAERDLEQSAHDFAREREEDLDPSSEAERSRVAAAFLWHQGHRRRALELADDSVRAHRQARSGELRKALELRAELRAATADLGTGEELEAALADVEEARDLLAAAPAADQTALVSLWLRILVLSHDRAERIVALPLARHAASGPLLLWFEGHCTAAAEPLWREARERFAELDDELWIARTTLDLARLCVSDGRAAEASALAAQLASTLGALAASPEDLAALTALDRGTGPVTEVASDDLDQAEHVLKRLEWNRRAQRALDLAM